MKKNRYLSIKKIDIFVINLLLSLFVFELNKIKFDLIFNLMHFEQQQSRSFIEGMSEKIQ
ncbi:hypothetical protein D7322_15205 [Sphingobacterium puteale]|uniref:Uncharacterized protein n=1 Tax=Sphingobacterium puteale TaxID=2420510 RepID=A0A420VW81_9SPHI|nr:hypothetical protein D7322_15205 [Sphingobacterium puteale]